MTDLALIKAARARAHAYVERDGVSSDQAARDGYQLDALADEVYGTRTDLWDGEQELIYRLAFAAQLISLGF